MDGNIMVDGVLVSCYASFDHDLAHIGMLPVRWFPTVMQLVFGRENNNPLFVELAKEFGRFLLPYSK